MAERISVACRACGAGWWGEEIRVQCPRCRGPLHVTGRCEVIDLLPERVTILRDGEPVWQGTVDG